MKKNDNDLTNYDSILSVGIVPEKKTRMKRKVASLRKKEVLNFLEERLYSGRGIDHLTVFAKFHPLKESTLTK